MSEWISVKDRLPPEGCVLVWIPHSWTVARLFPSGVYGGSKPEWLEIWSDREMKLEDGIITHWMPLPAAPTEATPTLEREEEQ